MEDLVVGRQSGLVVSEFDSRSKGCGFKSCLIQYTRCKWCHTMPESISVPSSGSFENKNKNTGSQMRHTNKKYLKKENQLVAIHGRLGSEDLLAKP